MNNPTNKLLLNYFCLAFLWAPMLLCCKKTSSQMAAGQFTAASNTTLGRPDSTVRRYLALGDSYTIGQSVSVKDRYPVQASALLRDYGFNMAEPEIIATSGWTTADLLDAIKDKPASPSFDLVTLLIGVNNQYQGGTMPRYRSEFTALLQKSIQYAGNRAGNVIVISIPDYSVTPFATNSDREKIAREIDSFNMINKKVADSLHVKYLDVTEESRKAAQDKSLIAYDGLHFSGKEYTIWSNALSRLMQPLLR